MSNQTADELLKLARFQRMDSRNCNEEAKDRLLGLMADQIEAGVRYVESTDKVLANAERLLDKRAEEIERGQRALAETHDAWTKAEHEVDQLRLDLAQQAMNGQTVMERQKELARLTRLNDVLERQCATLIEGLAQNHDSWKATCGELEATGIELDHAIEDVARLADVLRLVRNTQGGRFGHDWPYVANVINEVLRQTPHDVSGECHHLPGQAAWCPKCSGSTRSPPNFSTGE